MKTDLDEVNHLFEEQKEMPGGPFCRRFYALFSLQRCLIEACAADRIAVGTR